MNTQTVSILDSPNQVISVSESRQHFQMGQLHLTLLQQQ